MRQRHELRECFVCELVLANLLAARAITAQLCMSSRKSTVMAPFFRNHHMSGLTSHFPAIRPKCLEFLIRHIAPSLVARLTGGDTVGRKVSAALASWDNVVNRSAGIVAVVAWL